MAETDLTDWLPIDRAAAAIGCSKRTFERRYKAWAIEQRPRRQEGTPPVAVYNPDDVARKAAETRAAPAPFVLPAVSTGNGNGNGQGPSLKESPGSFLQTFPAGDDPIRQLFAAALRAVLSPPSPPVAETVAERPLLTLDEAAAWLRVDVRRVERLIQTKRLPVVKLSRYRADRRIKRTDLEAL